MIPDSDSPPPTAPLATEPLIDPWADEGVGEAVTEPETTLWQKIGGGGLTISVVLHAVVVLLAILIVFTIERDPPEKIEFLPGGGGGGKSNDSRAIEKRRAASISAPKTRITGAGIGDVSLPDLQTSMADFSSLSVATPMGGGMGGGSGGLKGSGSGGLMGNGRGTGFGPGSGSGFVSIPKIFGMDIDARRMAVVLDMSGSMYPFLQTVIKEVDKVAPGSTVVLHYGCGLNDTEVRRPGIESTSHKDFESDRIVTTLLESGTASMTKDQREELLAMVKKRPKTYFVPSSGVGSTWIALTDNRLKDADAIYWFADFADGLTTERMEDVARKFKSRKQKLYIHPSNPKWLDNGDPLAINVAKVENEIVKPSGGKVLNVQVKKEEPVKTKEKGKGKPDA